MKFKTTLLLFLAVTGATMSAAPSAHGFCRTMTGREPGDPPETNRCTGWNEVKENGCCPYGKPLYWKNACVGFSLQKDASRQVALSDAEQVFKRAFTTWTSTTCSLNGTPAGRVSLDVSYLGPVECGTVGFNEESPNQNVIVFRNTEWNHVDSGGTLGLTTVQYDRNSGEISGADMEINAFQSRPISITNTVPEGSVDLLSIATHEAGHFLGFAHSPVDDATMFASYRGITMRDLASDDTTGICNVYKPDQNRNTGDGLVPAGACNTTPRNGYASGCQEIPLSIEGGGCAVSPRSPASSSSSRMPSPLVMGLSVMSLVLLHRLRIRRSRRSHATSAVRRPSTPTC